MKSHELAQILEVEERSIRRYIMMLRDIGIPIEGERGRHGGYTLRPGFRLPPLMFNADETTAVILGLTHLRELGLTSIAAVESAIAKIGRVLPEELSQTLEAIRSILVFNNVLPGVWAIPNEWINTFALATHQGQCLQITYIAAEGEETQRKIAPYGVILHLKTWYAPAYCYLRGDMRVFRLDRVRAVTRAEDTFTRPVDFDVRAFVLNALSRFPDTYAFDILIHAPLTTIQEFIPPSLAVLTRAGEFTLMRCYSDDPHWLARYLTRLEVPFTVIENEALRDALRTLAHDILTNLGNPSASPISH
jgi:predicted DNA-binding transcriptional regulator YafY